MERVTPASIFNAKTILVSRGSRHRLYHAQQLGPLAPQPCLGQGPMESKDWWLMQANSAHGSNRLCVGTSGFRHRLADHP